MGISYSLRRMGPTVYTIPDDRQNPHKAQLSPVGKRGNLASLPGGLILPVPGQGSNRYPGLTAQPSGARKLIEENVKLGERVSVKKH